jgi:hypothetical protein
MFLPEPVFAVHPASDYRRLSGNKAAPQAISLVFLNTVEMIGFMKML